jgi:hypothetical protein
MFARTHICGPAGQFECQGVCGTAGARKIARLGTFGSFPTLHKRIFNQLAQTSIMGLKVSHVSCHIANCAQLLGNVNQFSIMPFYMHKLNSVDKTRKRFQGTILHKRFKGSVNALFSSYSILSSIYMGKFEQESRCTIFFQHKETNLQIFNDVRSK